MKITITHEFGPGTRHAKGESIYASLAKKLGREPTSKECEEEVKRILREGKVSK